jgi:thiol-disulfide isomerase/thioredoxin
MRLLFYSVILLFAEKLQAQTPITQGSFKYLEVISSVNKAGKNIQIQRGANFSFNESFFKKETKMMDKLDIIMLSDLAKSTTKSFANNTEKYYEIDEIFEPAFFDLGKYNEVKPTITLLAEESVISGAVCKKAIAEFLIDGTIEKIEVWYNPNYILQSKTIANTFKDIPGLPVSIVFNKKDKVVIGNGIPNRKANLILIDMFLTEQNDISKIAEADKYEYLSGDDKLQKLVDMAFASRKMPVITNKGTAIIDTVKIAGGNDIVLTKYNPFTVGEPLKNFTAVNLNGSSKSLKDYENKVLVLNFWHTACGPCIAEMPALNKVAISYANNNNVAFAAITFNSNAEVQKFLTKRQFQFEHFVNATNLVEQYAVSSYPATVIVDKQGIIRFVKIGDVSAELETELKKIL